MRQKHYVGVLLAVALVIFAPPLAGYWRFGPSWASGDMLMELQLGSSGGTLSDGSASWDISAERALARWNEQIGRSRFTVIRNSTAFVGLGNGKSNVFWSNDVYGTAFGTNVLAYALTWMRNGVVIEGDVLVNRAKTWNSYSGPWRYNPNTADLHRTLLHEFGHVLGLDHPDQHGQSVSAIMNSLLADLDHLAADDIAGGVSLYGSPSNPAPPTSPPTSASPGVPGSMAASASGSTVTLTWRAPTSGGTPTTYWVEAGSAVGAANLANFSTGTVATSFSAGGIGAGVYYVRVRAANASGISAASNEATLVVGGGGGGCSGPPTAPAALVGSATGSTVTLSWGAAGGAPTSYVVEAGSAPGLANLANSDTGSTGASLTAPGVGRGVYYVRVRAKNACGVGSASNEVVVTVL
jgi:hypothetical protein